jgi:hypothetical protein
MLNIIFHELYGLFGLREEIRKGNRRREGEERIRNFCCLVGGN